MNKNIDSKNNRFFYGWIIVIASFILLIGSFGVQLCFGVFLKPLSEEFGWTRAATSGAMSVVMGISGLIAIIMGRLTDKYNVRIIIIIGVLIGGLSYLLLSNINSLWQLYLYFGLGAGICMGSTYTPVNATVSKWFVEKRALALGIAIMGITVGQMVLSPITAYIITEHGWRTAYLVLSIVVFVTAIPAVILIGKTPPVPAQTKSSQSRISKSEQSVQPQLLSAREASQTAPFWMLMITGFVISAGFYFFSSHIVTYATDIGISVTAAALILTVGSIGGIAGTLLAWPITVKLGNKYALLVLIAGEALAMFLFIFTKSTWSFYSVAIIFGFSVGAASPVRLAMVPPLFGLKSIGTLLGIATFAWSAGGIVGPFLAGYIFDVSQSYDIAFVAGGVLLIIGVLAVYFFGSHRKKLLNGAH
jgi:OFA family oxalate/formate antiporter-like MFS transporter